MEHLDCCSICFAPLTSAGALFCSQSCRSKDASFSSRPRPLLPASASSTSSSSSSSTAARLANNRPQLTIAMPLSFAPSSRLGPHSATIPSPSVPLPTKEQLAARSRRYTAPSSRHPLLHSQPQPCAISSNGAGAGFPSSPAARPRGSAGGATLASPFPSHPIVLPQGYQTSPRASQHRRTGAEAVNGNDDDETRRLLSSQTIASATGNGKRYVSSAPNPQPQQRYSPAMNPVPTTTTTARFTGRDRTGVLDWVAQVNMHTPPSPSSPASRHHPHPHPHPHPATSSSSLRSRQTAVSSSRTHAPSQVLPITPVSIPNASQRHRSATTGTPTGLGRKTTPPSSAGAGMPRSLLMPLSRPSQPAPPLITAPLPHSTSQCGAGKRSNSSLLKRLREGVKKIEGEDVEIEVDESATLVTQPSSSALETLSYASFHFDDEEQQSQTTQHQRYYGCGRSYGHRHYGSSSPSSVEEEGEGDEEETSGAKTLSPPPPQLRKPIVLPGTPLPPLPRPVGNILVATGAQTQRSGALKKSKFIIGGGDSDSCASSYSSSSSSSFSSSPLFRARSRSRSRFQTSASPFSEGDEDRLGDYQQDSGVSLSPRGTAGCESFACSAARQRSQVFSLEDLLAATASQSHFSDDSDEEEYDDEDGEGQVEDEEGERECDFWQTRGRAPRHAVAPTPTPSAVLPSHHHYHHQHHNHHAHPAHVTVRAH